MKNKIKLRHCEDGEGQNRIGLIIAHKRGMKAFTLEKKVEKVGRRVFEPYFFEN